MVNSNYDPEEVESERTVIISEREGSENEPLFRLSEAVQLAAFTTHPYRMEIIGSMEDLNSIKRDNFTTTIRRTTLQVMPFLGHGRGFVPLKCFKFFRIFMAVFRFARSKCGHSAEGTPPSEKRVM